MLASQLTYNVGFSALFVRKDLKRERLQYSYFSPREKEQCGFLVKKDITKTVLLALNVSQILITYRFYHFLSVC